MIYSYGTYARVSTLKKIRHFFHLSRKQKKLFFLNWFFCGVARGVVCVIPFKRLYPYLGQHCQMLNASTLLSPGQIQTAIALGQSIRLAAKYTPWDSSCLTQALVARFWCRWYKIPCFLFIGVPKTRRRPSDSVAHAWVMAGPIAMTGGDNHSTHTVVSSFATHYLKDLP